MSVHVSRVLSAPDAEARAAEVRPVVEQLPPEQDAERVQRHHALRAGAHS